MPRRARFTEKKTGVWQHFKGLISDEHTWFSLVYMVLQMPLGIIYFTLFITLAAVSLVLVRLAHRLRDLERTALRGIPS